MMKKILTILLLFTCLYLNATTYYVKTGGNDALSGTSTANAWASLTKVNGFTFVAGDNILFNRGDTFYSSLNINQPGSSNSVRITFGAYGAGADPIITGFTTISGWTSVGSGVYSKAITVTDLNMVTMNDVVMGKGRYPREGSWLYNDNVGSGSITDGDMSSSSFNWATNNTARIFIKTEGYRWNHGKITGHSGTTISYDQTDPQSTWCGGNSYAGWGYFIDNDLRTLGTVLGTSPSVGDWFHNGTTLYMYFGAIDPTTKVVKVASLTEAVTCSQSYVTIDNISFLGFNGTGFVNEFGTGTLQLSGSSYVSVTNCEIGFSGLSSILCGSHMTIDNCWIHDGNAHALNPVSGALDQDYLTMTNSTVENIGLIYSLMGGWTARGMATNFLGVNNMLIQYNTFRHIGSVGVYFSGDNNTVDKNFFDDNASKAYDSGAIYTKDNGTNNVISNNIILNTHSSGEGTTPSFITPNMWATAEGIYLDEPCSGVTITGNTVYNTYSGNGIKLHDAHEIVITNNTLYNNFEGIQLLTDGVYAASDPIRGNTITGNKTITANGSPYMLVLLTDVVTPKFGTASGNYYCRPVWDGTAGAIHQPGGTNWNVDFWAKPNSQGDDKHTFAQWQSLTGRDLDSHWTRGTVPNESQIHFNYNATKYAVNYTVSGSIFNIAGTTVSPGTISIPSYGSSILFGTGTVTSTTNIPILPSVTTSAISLITQTSATSGGNITSNGGTQVTQAGIVWDITPYPDLTPSAYGGYTNDYNIPNNITTPYTSYLGNTLMPNTVYYVRAYAINSAGTIYGPEVQFLTHGPTQSYRVKGNGHYYKINGQWPIIVK